MLYGRTSSTYKFALATVLHRMAGDDITDISLDDLAADFLDTYIERLANGLPQLNKPNNSTAMETIVDDLASERIDRDRAIARTRREGFHNVLDAFHSLREKNFGHRFFTIADGRIRVADVTIALLAGSDATDHALEIDARWSLLEGSFRIQRQVDRLRLICDDRSFYLADVEAGPTEETAPARRPITTVSAALHGYQAGRCAYCAEPVPASAPVASILPGVASQGSAWNLAVAHPECATIAAETFPGTELIQNLTERNERLIASSDPLSGTIVGVLGNTPSDRRRAISERHSSSGLRTGGRRQGGGGAYWPGG